MIREFGLYVLPTGTELGTLVNVEQAQDVYLYSPWRRAVDPQDWDSEIAREVVAEWAESQRGQTDGLRPLTVAVFPSGASERAYLVQVSVWYVASIGQPVALPECLLEWAEVHPYPVADEDPE